MAFKLTEAVPVDLFPHTPHCELVMKFERETQKSVAPKDETVTGEVSAGDVAKLTASQADGDRKETTKQETVVCHASSVLSTESALDNKSCGGDEPPT